MEQAVMLQKSIHRAVSAADLGADECISQDPITGIWNLDVLSTGHSKRLGAGSTRPEIWQDSMNNDTLAGSLAISSGLNQLNAAIPMLSLLATSHSLLSDPQTAQHRFPPARQEAKGAKTSHTNLPGRQVYVCRRNPGPFEQD